MVRELIKKLTSNIIGSSDGLIASRRDNDPNKVSIDHEEVLKEFETKLLKHINTF